MRMVVVEAMPVMMIVVPMIVATLKELRLDVEDAVEIEGVAVEHLGDRDRAALGAMERAHRVDGRGARFDLAQVGVADEIGLVEKDHVGEGDLVLGLEGVAQPVLEPARVGDGDDGVELRLAADRLVDEEGLRHRRGSASPVVSTMMASNLPLRRISPSMMPGSDRRARCSTRSRCSSRRFPRRRRRSGRCRCRSRRTR